jgi:type II secretory pathway pseudopilin PulG
MVTTLAIEKRTIVKTRTSGLTVIEILVVVGIIAMLVGLLLPAVHKVQTMAKEVKQKAQFTSIELALAAFKSDFGDYPPSNWWNPDPTGTVTRQDYCGAQKLSEALLGWDLLGFHPDSAWRADGLDRAGGPLAYDPLKVNAAASLDKRKGRYVELEHANVFQLGDSVPGGRDGLFPDTSNNSGNQPLERRTFVLCDVFTVNDRKILMNSSTLAVPGVAAQMASPGTPILYYKANPASKVHADAQVDPQYRIYNVRDNWPLVSLGMVADALKDIGLRRHHPLSDANFFYEYIRDPKIQARPWPYRPDSYLLISAGADGLYGTNDDIRNFGQ